MTLGLNKIESGLIIGETTNRKKKNNSCFSKKVK